MEVVLYSEISIFCIFLLTPLLFTVKKENMSYTLKHLFAISLSFIILFIFTDLLWYYSVNKVINFPRFIKYIIDILNFTSSGLAAYAWFLYSEKIQNPSRIKQKKFLLLSSLPILLLIIVTLIPSLMFIITKEGIYERGPFFILEFAIPCFYLGLTSLKALIMSGKRKNYAYKNEFLSLASFAIAPTIATLLQLFIAETPLTSIGMCVAAIWVYQRQQALLVSIDPLTGLNNRYEMTRFLSNKMNHIDSDKALYLLVSDVDYFKKINDKYGHVEGDYALLIIAEALKIVATKHRCFVSRYGGDEFVIIFERRIKDISIQEFCNSINENISKLVEKANLKYSLKLSIGYSLYNSNMQSLLDFLDKADLSLYEVKRNR
ncbi:MAG: GGDEF domain-containing protein [Spirochaetales bacterium]|nr:GGDEF domain-containing protein [Spirochaetales bacterium]